MSSMALKFKHIFYSISIFLWNRSAPHIDAFVIKETIMLQLLVCLDSMQQSFIIFTDCTHKAHYPTCPHLIVLVLEIYTDGLKIQGVYTMVVWEDYDIFTNLMVRICTERKKWSRNGSRVELFSSQPKI